MEIIESLKWWQKAVFYQIYPRSFADGNGDGIGDFPGIISKLDYLQSLGIDAVWLSPHYPSPNYDCGYDIADYLDVAPEYGTLDQFQQFLDGAHQRGIRVILDMVLNHTSDQHAWFKESRSNKNNPKRDWYIWKNGVNGDPPNNWNSTFGGSAWEMDQTTGQYYYHFFFKEQPDLNWRNPEVKVAMFNAVRFWLERGVDGFRLDAIGTIFEHPEYPNHPVPLTPLELRRTLEMADNPNREAEFWSLWRSMEQYQVEQPGMHELMQELRKVIDEYDDRILVGEDENISYHGKGDNELHMVFNFPLMETERLTPTWIRRNQANRLKELAQVNPEAWPCNTLGNHDASRVQTRFGDRKHDPELARLSLALMLTLRGTPFLYNGEEIGMTDFMLTDIGKFRDTLGIRYYQAQIEEFGLSPGEALARASLVTRDKTRTPMQWTHQPNGGFCPVGVDPWLPVNLNYLQGVNVQDQEDDPASMLNFYRQMIGLRKHMPALIGGTYVTYRARSRNILAFYRQVSKQICLVAINFKPRPTIFNLPENAHQIELRFSNKSLAEKCEPGKQVRMQPFQILIFEVFS